MKKTSVITATLVALLGLVVSPVVAASPPDDGTPDQQQMEIPDPNWGNWTSMKGGVSQRPYVTKFSVINGSTVTEIITAGTPAAETDVPAGRLAVAISPNNLCRQGQSPAPGVCYATPNRISVLVGYQRQSGQMGYDFKDPKVPLLTPVDEDTEFDITLSLNTLGKTLRWTWANGVPTYWSTTNLGQDGATLRIRLKPALSPVVVAGEGQGGCTQVPVSACEYTQATHEVLGANMVLSLDSTLDAVFTGALFSSTRSFIGSLMTASGETPQMTYGLSAPQTWSDGSANKALFHAVLSDAAILNFFGATPDAASTPEFRAAALNVTRADGGTQGATEWTRWGASERGTDGWLISIPDISFVSAASSAEVGKSAVSSAAKKVAPAQFKVRAKTKPVLRASASGARTTVKFSVKAPACAKYSCRVVVSSISSKVSKSVRKLSTVSIKKKTASLSFSSVVGAKKGQRLAVVVQAKKNGKWVYVSSTMGTSK